MQRMMSLVAIGLTIENLVEEVWQAAVQSTTKIQALKHEFNSLKAHVEDIPVE